MVKSSQDTQPGNLRTATRLSKTVEIFSVQHSMVTVWGWGRKFVANFNFVMKRE